MKDPTIAEEVRRIIDESKSELAQLGNQLAKKLNQQLDGQEAPYVLTLNQPDVKLLMIILGCGVAALTVMAKEEEEA